MRCSRLLRENTLALRSGTLASVLALAVCLGACSDDRSTVDTVFETDETGALLRFSGPDDLVAPPTDDTTLDKAGCTHIRYCTKPGTSNLIVCDTNDRSCTSDQRFNECRSDARYVCGRTSPMQFDPPIPCPISGVC